MGLKVGDQIMHRGRAMEMLYLVMTIHRHSGNVYLWKVKLLFVSPREEYEYFFPGDSYKHLHTKKAA